jgi:hypothetical protein
VISFPTELDNNCVNKKDLANNWCIRAEKFPNNYRSLDFKRQSACHKEEFFGRTRAKYIYFQKYSEHDRDKEPIAID